jgi:single-strand DNA-binding protein
MASFNKVILVGNLTRDPELRHIPSGKAVCEIGLAVNRTWWDKQTNTRKEVVTFVDVTLWDRQAEVAAEYLSKGSPLLIEGHLHLDQWDDKQSGQKKSKLKVVAEVMQFLGGRKDGGTSGAPSGNRGGAQSEPAEPSGAPDFYSDSPSPPQDEVPF